MSVTCHELVAAVETFSKVATCEAEWRGICNRAYYSVYHDAQAFHDELAAAGFPGTVNPLQKGGMHMDMCTRLVNTTVPKGDPRRQRSRQVGAIMMNMLLLRTKADYKPKQDMDLIAAQNTVNNARDALQLLHGQSTGAPVPAFSASTAPANPPTTAPTSATPVARPANPVRNGFKVVK